MSDLIDAIRAERRALIEPLLAPIADKLRALDEIEHLALSLNGGGSDVAVAAPARVKAKAVQRALPAKAKATGRGRDGLSAQAAAALEKVRAASGPISRSEAGASTHVMQALVSRGLIEAIGNTSQRRYRAADQDNVTGQAALVSRRLPAPADPAPATAYDATTRRIARGRIMDHLARRKLDEPSLAALGIDREEVAFICGQLLEEGKIVRAADGRAYEVVS